MTTALLASTAANSGPQVPSDPGVSNTGLCTLTFQGSVFRFRTNPNEIWWTYELLTNVEETYGGKVIQLLGTRLGDLNLKVECGMGNFAYLQNVVTYLRNLLSDQRNGNTAQFAYTTRNWVLNVYSLSIPFLDQVEATTREIELSFKIQEDVTNVITQVSLDAELLRLQDGVSTPGAPAHNQYNDPNGQLGNIPGSNLLPGSIITAQNPSGPTYSASGITNTVDTDVSGDDPGGLNIINGIPGLNLSAIPGVGQIIGGSG